MMFCLIESKFELDVIDIVFLFSSFSVCSALHAFLFPPDVVAVVVVVTTFTISDYL